MVFDRMRWAVGWRLAVLVGLTATVSVLLERTHLYATSLIATLMAAAVGLDLVARSRHPADAARIRAPRTPGDYQQALLDTVPAALIVMEDSGRALLVNRAAQRLTRTGVSRLADVESLGVAGAERIAGIEPGHADLLRLADGRHVLVSVGEFASSGHHRLVALQFVTGDLDAVEIKAWRDMLRVLRHEIMNSLTPIASLSETLASQPSSPDLQASLDAINRRSRSLMHFVERYREVSDPIAVNRADVDAAMLLKNLERLVAIDCAAAGVGADFTVVPPRLIVRADTALLEQAALNLVKNALEAVAKTAAPRVTVEFSVAGGEACLSVADNGPGVPPERREQVFMPFFTTKKTGSGIGLAVAREIALAHGGRISYAPDPAGGARFELTLGPASAADAS